MAFFNSVFFLTLLVAISASMAAPSSVDDGLVVLPTNIIYINGTVRCVDNTTLVPNNIPLANGTVELKCGPNRTTVARNTTNANGTFIITLQPYPDSALKTLVETLKTVKNCSAVVTTPFTSCNITLSTNGTLTSPLTKGPIVRTGNLRIFFIFVLRFLFIRT